MVKKDYYTQQLSAERLRRCYEIAPPRVRQYLDAEIEFVLSRIKPANIVLELGCGYGRVLKQLVERAKTVVGIDTSLMSLHFATEFIGKSSPCYLSAMDAIHLGFHDQTFDMVICIQNGISAFKVDQWKLIEEAIRVTRTGGTALFSSYSDHFWEHRLDWFRLQAKYGLIGEIDEVATGNGTIVCKDGFRATTIGPHVFFYLTSALGVKPVITEVDKSSVFCEIPVDL